MCSEESLASLRCTTGRQTSFGAPSLTPLLPPRSGLLRKSNFLSGQDQLEPEILSKMDHAARHITHVWDVPFKRARWLGHQVYAEMTVSVDSGLSLKEAHQVAKRVHRQLVRHLPFLHEISIHVDPSDEAGMSHLGKTSH